MGDVSPILYKSMGGFLEPLWKELRKLMSCLHHQISCLVNHQSTLHPTCPLTNIYETLVPAHWAWWERNICHKNRFGTNFYLFFIRVLIWVKFLFCSVLLFNIKNTRCSSLSHQKLYCILESALANKKCRLNLVNV